MDFYLSFNNKAEELRLPITPSAFDVGQSNMNTTVTVNQLGEVNLIGKSGLATVSIESFFPNQEYSFCTYTGFPTPYECVGMIKAWKNSGKPIRLVVTGTDVNYAMAIESFNYGESDGTGDVYFTLELKEYVFVKTDVKQETVTSNGTKIETPSTSRESKPVQSSYVVQKGDTLWGIAKKITGNGDNYKAIAKANGITDPDKITVGQRLVI